jgi:predicted nucleotidyltransferase
MTIQKEISQPEIKATILRCLDELGVKLSQIILFGSRARGDYSKFSDYDFLIVTKDTFPIKEKMKIAASIRTALAELYVSVDVIINSEEEIAHKKIR